MIINQAKSMNLAVISYCPNGVGIMSDPIKFERGVLYPLPWIEQQLGDLMSLKTFLTNYGLEGTGRGRASQNAVTGDEVLEAMAIVAATKKTLETEAAAPSATNLATKRLRGRPAKNPLQRVTAQELVDRKA